MKMPEVVHLSYDEEIDELFVVGEDWPEGHAYVEQSASNDLVDHITERMLHYRALYDKAMAKLAEKGMDLNV